MARKSFVLLVVGMVIFFLCSVSSADVPHMINYQGKLTTASGGCLNDTVQMTFSIYPDTLGSPADWTETQTEVVVKEGIFNVLLGAVDTIPSAVFDGNVKYLGVQVEADPEMRPLKPMVSVGYAYTTENADKVDGYHAGNSSGQVAVSNGTQCTDLNADMVDGYHAGSFMQIRTQGTVLVGSTVTLVIPHYKLWTLQLSSGWPHGGGVCFVQGFENDWYIGVTYVKYNGNGTSGYGGAEGPENSNTTLVSFGPLLYKNSVKCPGEESGDHNIKLTASGWELKYRLIY